MITATNGIGAAGINYTGALTPEALMMYCASRLSGIDTQVSAQFERQQQYRQASSAINRLQTKFAERAANEKGISTSLADHHDQYVETEKLWDDAINSLPPNSPQRAQLEQQRLTYNRSMVDKVGGDWNFSKDECSAMSTSLGSVAKDLGGSAELDMIQLQSLMSQRQTAIQMCTNLVAGLGESSKAIAAKIGT